MAEANTFYSYYNDLPNGTKKVVLLEYITKTEQSFGTFYRKVRNRSFTRIEQDSINEICGHKFDWSK